MQRKRTLAEQEISQLQRVTHTGRASAREIIRAKILLASSDGKTDTEICASERINRNTCLTVRKRSKAEGLQRALPDTPRPGGKKGLTKEEEAEVIALYCSEPPDGHTEWTMELVTEECNKKTEKHVSKNTIWRVTLRSAEKPWRKKNVVHTQGDGGVSQASACYSGGTQPAIRSTAAGCLHG